MHRSDHVAAPSRRFLPSVAIAGMLAATTLVASIAPSIARPADGYRSDSFRHHFFRGQYNHGVHAGKPRFGSAERDKRNLAPLASNFEADIISVR